MLSVCLTVLLLISACSPLQGSDWPWWRGPFRNGVADGDQNPPLTWDADHHVVWRSEVPGRGHGSPIVVGNHVWLTAADESVQQQMLLCFDRTTGREHWRTVIHQGGLRKEGNRKATLASTTPACDGKHVYVNFLNSGAVWTTAVDLSGRIVWQKKVCDYVVHQGYGSSPAVYDGLVIVSADNKGGGAVAAFQADTGDLEWIHQRPGKPNYPSPVIMTLSGHDQVILTGCDLITGIDPRSGTVLWEVPGATTECVTSAVTDGQRIFTSGGYPENHISAVSADGSGTLIWRDNVRLYVPSMLIHDNHLFAVLDSGIAVCRETATGKTVWKHRLSGNFSSSPVLAGGRIYVTSESGTTYVYAASTERFRLLARNQLGDEVFATPVFCDDRIFNRIAHQEDGQRQEYLYCLGRSERSPKHTPTDRSSSEDRVP